MKNLLLKSAGAWILLLFLMFSCSDSLEEGIIESNMYEEHLHEQSLALKDIANGEETLKNKGGKHKEEETTEEDEKGNNGKSEDNKGKGKDKDSDDSDDDDEDSDDDDDDSEDDDDDSDDDDDDSEDDDDDSEDDDDDSEDDDDDSDDDDDDNSEDDDSDDDDDDDSEDGGNNGKSEENKGKGKDKDSNDDDNDNETEDENDSEDEDDSQVEEERGNNGKSEDNMGKGKDKDSDDDSEDETDEEITADFRTQTIGGWGANPRGNNPGSYLHENFDLAFPDGLTIGSDDLTVLFTSAQAITDFLPSGSKSQALTEAYVDPSQRELRNNFVSQLLAATLSVEFDKAIADFSKSDEALSRLTISEGDLSGLIVSQVLEEANLVIAGKESTYSLSQLHEGLTNINESFVDGKHQSGYLLTGK